MEPVETSLHRRLSHKMQRPVVKTASSKNKQIHLNLPQPNRRLPNQPLLNHRRLNLLLPFNL
jgi:hypothetical protein